jgi:hypothetical protein
MADLMLKEKEQSFRQTIMLILVHNAVPLDHIYPIADQLIHILPV